MDSSTPTDKVDEIGQRDNAIIVFAAADGESLGCARLPGQGGRLDRPPAG